MLPMRLTMAMKVESLSLAFETLPSVELARVIPTAASTSIKTANAVICLPRRLSALSHLTLLKYQCKPWYHALG